MSNHKRQQTAVVLAMCLLLPCSSFTVVRKPLPGRTAPSKVGFSSLMRSQRTASSSSITALRFRSDGTKDVESMKVTEIKQELESYGIATEKYIEMVLQETLKECRADIFGSSTTASYVYKYKSKQDEDLEKEIQKCEKMKNAELKAELRDRGVSTASLFERSQFVKALAQARLKGADDAEHKVAEILPENHEGPRPKGHGKKKQESEQDDFSQYHTNGGAQYKQYSGGNSNKQKRKSGGFNGVQPFEPNFTM